MRKTTTIQGLVIVMALCVWLFFSVVSVLKFVVVWPDLRKDSQSVSQTELLPTEEGGKSLARRQRDQGVCTSQYYAHAGP
jgi:hypothetical protein